MLLIVLLLSIVQGITEFLPISSSAHLFIIPWLFNLQAPGLSFDAAIHVGTALALVVFFFSEFRLMIKNKDRILKFVIIASIPAAIIGFFGEKLIDNTFHQGTYAPLIIGIGLIVFSGILYFVDKTASLNRNIEHICLKDSLIIGFAQVLALVPGTSRSGITMTAGLWLGLKREAAAKFSFLMATPISLGAGLYKLQQITTGDAGVVSIELVIVGIIITFFVGLAAIKWLLNYLKNNNMSIFVWYRIILGLVIITTWIVR